MRIFILFILAITFSTFANADYTIKSVYKLENSDMIKNHDDSNILNTTVNGIAVDSKGNKSTIKCLINLKNSVLFGNCHGVDQDGDADFYTVKRDMSKGPEGTWVRTGGTGKYANSDVNCVYLVELTDFTIGVGYLTATCKE